MKRPRPESNSSHLAGEYFVAAELYKRGYSVAITIGNAKAIDLFAEKRTKSVNVQVKAIRDRKSSGWPMWKRGVKSNIVYIFVCLNSPDQPPTYFVATSREARPRIREYRTRGVLNLGSINSSQFFDRWDKVERALK